MPLVTVIIPVYNGAETVAETLKSVLDQHHVLLEVIVVDDGSRDDSLEVSKSAAGSDPRVTFLHQPNQGVAAARNLGIAKARGAYLAFIDADDIWFEGKLARQVEALKSGGPLAGVCYCGYVEIDDAGVWRSNSSCPNIEGSVLHHLCAWNFVGNGSSMLVRREALEAVGSFDTTLRARDAQGCEDYDLLLRLAARFEFRVIPEILVGYRVGGQSMSADFSRMIRSWRLVSEGLARSRPDLQTELDRGLASYAAHLFVGAARRFRLPQCWRIAGAMRGLKYGFSKALVRVSIERLYQVTAKLTRYRAMLRSTSTGSDL